jgi:hypothetical protein
LEGKSLAHIDCKEGLSTSKDPLFDRTNYALWSIIMNTYLMTLRFSIWESVIAGYIDEARKESSENNAKEIDVILSGLLDS